MTRGEQDGRVEGVESAGQLGERLGLQRLDMGSRIDGRHELLHRGVADQRRRRATLASMEAIMVGELVVQLGAGRLEVERFDRRARSLQLVAEVVG